jgi:glycerol-1-phosphate dehydrogenase [NAD(P)+]
VPAPSNISAALARARDTQRVEFGARAIHRSVDVFREQFGARAGVIVADLNTMSAAGNAVAGAFARAGHAMREPFVFSDPRLHAEYVFVEELETALRRHEAIPLAVGAGVINDVTKLAAHRAGRPYLCVATAASMDGYTAYGASITRAAVKQTFDCPAPRAVVADIDVIRAAPPELAASGYADLLAKIAAGADWILAEALGVEPIDPNAWDIVQGHLRDALCDPAGVRRGDPVAIERLMAGLLMSGLAMQAHQSSRPASGAEHQFSHLWDMQHHVDPRTGVAPSHGFKVGIGTIAVAELYERLLADPIDLWLNVDRACAAWPADERAAEAEVRRLFADHPELLASALSEAAAKYVPRETLRAHLHRVREVWPQLSGRLRGQLIPVARLREMLASAGAPIEPEQIGISAPRLRFSFRLAHHIRRRYTVLDLAARAGVLPG